MGSAVVQTAIETTAVEVPFSDGSQKAVTRFSATASPPAVE